MATIAPSPSLHDAAERYRQQGFVVLEKLLPMDRIDVLRMRMHDIAVGRVPEFPPGDVELEPAVQGNEPRQVRKINRCAENDSLFMSHAADPRILDVVELLIGPDIKLYASQCFMKPPGGVEKPYHQDSAYFTIEPMELVTCWTALDDVTLDNGCMWMIPGSHRGGIVDHGKWQIGDREDKQVPDVLLDRSREIPITMSAGSCSFHHSLMLHRSGRNHSNQPRRGLAIHYMSAQSRWTNSHVPQPDYRLLRGRAYRGCV